MIDADTHQTQRAESPWMLYRNFANTILSATNPAQRLQSLKDMLQFLQQMQFSGDWKRMKWLMPPWLSSLLKPEEMATLEQALSEKRKKRNERLIEVYPPCSDEFSTSFGFLDAAFGNTRHGLITKQTPIFAIGSCFAGHIANRLAAKSYRVTPFHLTEDINSAFSNAKMFAVCAADAKTQEDYVSYWVRATYPNHPDIDLDTQIKNELAHLQQLHQSLQQSEFIIITCGNVLDYFIAKDHESVGPGPLVAPKFLAIGHYHDIETKRFVNGKLTEAGATFRMGNYQEIPDALEALYRAVRTINPTAQLLFTLSPVPINNALGLQQEPRMGAIELDCISKSMLRGALVDRMQAWRDDKAVHYFPSFEIVRWIGACMGKASFGEEDGSAWHVSEHLFTGVCDYFLYKFCED